MSDQNADKAAHTPGPWEVMSNPQSFNYIVKSGAKGKECIVAVVTREMLALRDGGSGASQVDVGDARANAQIVAAAPTMFEALYVALEALDAEAINYEPKGFGGRSARAIVRAAIGQASGAR